MDVPRHSAAAPDPVGPSVLIASPYSKEKEIAIKIYHIQEEYAREKDLGALKLGDDFVENCKEVFHYEKFAIWRYELLKAFDYYMKIKLFATAISD